MVSDKTEGVKGLHMGNKVSIVAWLVVSLTMLFGCGGDDSTGQPVATKTAITDQSMQELVIYTPEGGKLVSNLIEIFMRASGLTYKVRIFEGVTTTLSMEGLKDGTFDLVFMHRRPRPTERIEFLEILRSNVAIFTHPDASVDNLTAEEIAAIFSGEITNWSEVGGSNQDIIPFILPEFESHTEALRAVALGDTPFSESARFFPNERSLILSVTGIPGGVGYASWATKKYLEIIEPDRADPEFHIVSVEGITLDDPSYPIFLVVGFGYLPEREAYLNPFLDWITEFLDSSQSELLLQLFDVSTTVEE